MTRVRMGALAQHRTTNSNKPQQAARPGPPLATAAAGPRAACWRHGTSRVGILSWPRAAMVVGTILTPRLSLPVSLSLSLPSPAPPPPPGPRVLLRQPQSPRPALPLGLWADRLHAGTRRPGTAPRRAGVWDVWSKTRSPPGSLALGPPARPRATTTVCERRQNDCASGGRRLRLRHATHPQTPSLSAGLGL